jgi:hypothetical protein
VRQYAEILALGDPDDPDVWEEAEDGLIGLAEQIVRERRPGRVLRTGAVAYRVRAPVPPGRPGEIMPGRQRRPGRGSTGRPRITLVVVKTPRPEGPLPQLVQVREG